MSMLYGGFTFCQGIEFLDYSVMDTTLVSSKSSRTRRKSSDDDEAEIPRKRPRLNGSQVIGTTANVKQAVQVAAQSFLTRVPPSSLHCVSLSPSTDDDDDDDGNGVQSSSSSGPSKRCSATAAPKLTARNATRKAPAQESIQREPVRQSNTTTTTTSSYPFARYHLTGGPSPVYRPPPRWTNRRKWNVSRILKSAVLFVCWWSVQAWYISVRSKKSTHHQSKMLAEFSHILHPKSSSSRKRQKQHSTNSDIMTPSSLTLRQVLTDTEVGYHLAMAPAFFGFYGYFGALEAWEHAVMTTKTNASLQKTIRSVAGASAGAMAAVLLASGISPQQAAAFCTTIQLHQFADFPGVGAVFRGNKFERTMKEFMQSQVVGHDDDDDDVDGDSSLLLLEDSKIPVAVTAFDVQTMQGKILTRGSMARAARASATFPFLFQPVGWTDATNMEDYVFVDGGIADMHGMVGVEAFLNQVPSGSRQRVINLKVGGFRTKPPGPSTLSIHGKNDTVVEVITISLQNLPQPGPWALANGPIAVEAARQAMLASLDVPLFPRSEKHHYELHIDTSHFWKL